MAVPGKKQWRISVITSCDVFTASLSNTGVFLKDRVLLLGGGEFVGISTFIQLVKVSPLQPLRKDKD